MSTLEEQINNKSREISTEQYSMSIGEMMSLYKEKEIDIHPEFQRFFRWDENQKSMLIESIFLGIPIPSIFISQKDNGVWDIIDGLQRLSTIFEFAGILRDKDDNLLKNSRLVGTKYLPALEGKVWDSADANSLSMEQRLFIKRAKLNLQIIKRESNPDTKYDLFQRLNSGGTALTSQELRNCILIMVDETFYSWLTEIVDDENFQNCTALSDKNIIERYDLELALRFFINKNSTEEELNDFKDIGEYITRRMIDFTNEVEFDRDKEKIIFKNTFSMINKSLNERAFKKYNPEKSRFQGGFSISSFEVVSTGVAFNIDSYDENSPADCDLLKNKIQNLWSLDDFNNWSGAGVQAYRRIKKFVPLSKTYFKKDEN